MATEIREAGYQTIRDFVEGDWDYIELRDSNDSQVTRVSVSGDSRAQWTHSDGDQTLVAEIVVTGADDDIPLGTTFTGSALFNTDSGGDELSYDGFTDATIEADNDELTVTHEVEIPQV